MDPTQAPLLLIDSTAIASTALPSSSGKDALSGLRILRDKDIVEDAVLPDQVVFEMTGLLPSSLEHFRQTLKNIRESTTIDPKNRVNYFHYRPKRVVDYIRSLADASPRTGTQDRIAARTMSQQSILSYLASTGFDAHKTAYVGATSVGKRYSQLVADELAVTTGTGTTKNQSYALSLDDLLWQMEHVNQRELTTEEWDALERMRVTARMSMHMALVGEAELKGHAHSEKGPKAKAAKKANRRECRRHNGVERYLTQAEILYDCGLKEPVIDEEGNSSTGRNITNDKNAAVIAYRVGVQNLKDASMVRHFTKIGKKLPARITVNDGEPEFTYKEMYADLKFLRQAMEKTKDDFHGLLKEHAPYRKLTLGDAFRIGIIADDFAAQAAIAKALHFPSHPEAGVASSQASAEQHRAYKQALEADGFFETPLSLEVLQSIAKAVPGETLGGKFARYLAPLARDATPLLTHHTEAFNKECAGDCPPSKTIHYERLFANAVDTGTISLDDCMRIAARVGLAQKVEGFKNVYRVPPVTEGENKRRPMIINSEKYTISIPKGGSGLFTRMPRRDMYGDIEWMPKSLSHKPKQSRTKGKAPKNPAEQINIFDAPNTSEPAATSTAEPANVTPTTKVQTPRKVQQVASTEPPEEKPELELAAGADKEDKLLSLKQCFLRFNREQSAEAVEGEEIVPGVTDPQWRERHADALSFIETLFIPLLHEGKATELHRAAEEVLGHEWMTQLDYNFAASHLNQLSSTKSPDGHPGQQRLAAAGESIYSMQRELGDFSLMELASKSAKAGKPAIIVARENGIRETIENKALTPFFKRVRQQYHQGAGLDLQTPDIAVVPPNELGETLATLAQYANLTATPQGAQFYAEHVDTLAFRAGDPRFLRSDQYPILDRMAKGSPFAGAADDIIKHGVRPRADEKPLLARIFREEGTPNATARG